MAALASQFSGLRCSPISSSTLSRPGSATGLALAWPAIGSSLARGGEIVSAARIGAPLALTPVQKEREALKKLFEEAYDRARIAPLEGVAFTLEDFHAAIEKYDFDSEIGSKVILTFFHVLLRLPLFCDGFML